MQRDHLAYEWNDVALLADQRAYTIICKTMLQIPQQDLQTIHEIQDVVLSDWTWQSESLCSDAQPRAVVPFQGSVTLQIYYLNQDFQQETFFVDVPIEGAWQEPLTQQNSMRLIFHHTQIAEGHLLLETVLQINRSQPLERTQVLLGQFQMEEQLMLEEPWPPCDALLATSVTLTLQDCEIAARQLTVRGESQLVCVYQCARQPGEQVFVYEQRIPMEAAILVPDGLQELNGLMPYYQSITAQVLDEQQIQIVGSGVFCTLPVLWDAETMPQTQLSDDAIFADEEEHTDDIQAIQQDKREASPSVVNSRGSRRANLSKYMRNLNNSVESPTSVRNIELHIDSNLPD